MVPLQKCKELSSKALADLVYMSNLNGLLDVCSGSCERRELREAISFCYEIQQQTASSTSSGGRANLLGSVLGDAFSTPLTGIDAIGSGETFKGQSDWSRLLRSTASNKFSLHEKKLVSNESAVDLQLPCGSHSLSAVSHASR